MCPPPAASPSPRGPVLRASLRANAVPFTPTSSASASSSTGYVEVVHNSITSSGSQPVIQRRNSQNPTFHTAKKRMSMHGNIGSGRRASRPSQAADQNAAPNNGNGNSNKDQAKSFSSEAFKKNAAKAYLAKKRAQDLANANAININIGPSGNKKEDARKAFARRQSQKLLKRQAAVDRTKRIDEALELDAKLQQSQPSINSTTSSTNSTTQIVADVCNMSTSSLASSRPTSTSSSASVEPPAVNLTSHEDNLLSTPNTNEPPAKASINDANISTVSIEEADISTVSITDAPISNTNTTNSNSTSSTDTATVPTLSINTNTVNSSSIEPITAAVAVPKSAPAVRSTLVASNSMSIIPSCSVDIAQLPRSAGISQAMSSCTMSTVSGGSSFDGSSCTTTGRRGKQTAMMPSSGKWCDDCAGVGLHIAAMMTTISGWRAEEERRSSNTSTSGKTTSSNSGGGGWKRRMSQTLIGVSSSSSSHGSSKTPSEVEKEKQRLEQQVDVLTLTVQFLYERLEKQGAATADVTDAVRRCT